MSLAKRIHKDTENNASEYLLNVLGDILMQGFTGRQ